MIGEGRPYLVAQITVDGGRYSPTGRREKESAAAASISAVSARPNWDVRHYLPGDNRAINFTWNEVSCTHSGYTLRIQTDSNLDDLAGSIVDTGVGPAPKTV